MINGAIERENMDDSGGRRSWPTLLGVLREYRHQPLTTTAVGSETPVREKVCTAVTGDGSLIASSHDNVLVVGNLGRRDGAMRVGAASEVVQLCNELTTALAWLSVAAVDCHASERSPRKVAHFLLRGTDSGNLYVYTPRLEKAIVDEIHIHDGPIESIAIRTDGCVASGPSSNEGQAENRGRDAGASTLPRAGDLNELNIMCKFILARIQLAGLIALLPDSPLGTAAAAGGDRSALFVEKFDVSSRVGDRSGGFCVGIVQPSLYKSFQSHMRPVGEMSRKSEVQGSLALMTCGRDPPIAAFSVVDTDVSKSSRGPGDLLAGRNSGAVVHILPVRSARHQRCVPDTSLRPSANPGRRAQAGDTTSQSAASLISTLSSMVPFSGGPSYGSRIATSIHPSPSACASRGGGLDVGRSPGAKFFALTDNIGRVLLCDPLTVSVLRIWKGYRNAQVAWTTIAEDEKAEGATIELLIVIYAPMKGVIEIWEPLGVRRAQYEVHVSPSPRGYEVGGAVGAPPVTDTSTYCLVQGAPVIWVSRGRAGACRGTRWKSEAVFLVDCSRFSVDVIFGLRTANVV